MHWKPVSWCPINSNFFEFDEWVRPGGKQQKQMKHRFGVASFHFICSLFGWSSTNFDEFFILVEITCFKNEMIRWKSMSRFSAILSVSESTWRLMRSHFCGRQTFRQRICHSWRVIQNPRECMLTHHSLTLSIVFVFWVRARRKNWIVQVRR